MLIFDFFSLGPIESNVMGVPPPPPPPPHHHQSVPQARISRTLSRYPFLSSIVLNRSSRLHLLSRQSYCRYVSAGCPTHSRPQEYVAYDFVFTSPIRLNWIVFVMSGRRIYRYCFVGCCLEDLYNTARSILV